MKINTIPVLAANSKAFRNYIISEFEVKDKPEYKSHWVSPTIFITKNEKYIYASSVQALSGLRFKSFISVGEAFLHPKHQEILGFVLHESQSNKKEGEK